jgi:hypothetical protein
MEIGIYTFGELTSGTAGQRMRDLLEEIELADQVGLDVEKILFQHDIFNHDRFLLQMSVGTLPHADVMRAIELLGTEVAPKVREALAAQAAKR